MRMDRRSFLALFAAAPAAAALGRGAVVADDETEAPATDVPAEGAAGRTVGLELSIRVGGRDVPVELESAEPYRPDVADLSDAYGRRSGFVLRGGIRMKGRVDRRDAELFRPLDGGAHEFTVHVNGGPLLYGSGIVSELVDPGFGIPVRVVFRTTGPVTRAAG